MNKRIHIYLSLIVILFILISLSLFSKKYLQQAVAYFTPQPETFTELYFENHQNLPSAVEVGETYSFAFTVHNEEYKKMQYPYTVYLQTDKQKMMIQHGTFTLNQDQKKTLNESFLAPAFSKRAEVVVNLDKLQQQIDFWINE